MKLMLLIIPVLFFISCGNNGNGGNEFENSAAGRTLNATGMDAKPFYSLFDLRSAMLVLGEPASLSDTSSGKKASGTWFMSSYKAHQKQKGFDREGAVYFLLENYVNRDSAAARYKFIHDANAANGISDLKDIGDEAYFHTDNENFYFAMVRKGPVVFNIKVNRLTSLTSREQFDAVVKEITDRI